MSAKANHSPHSISEKAFFESSGSALKNPKLRRNFKRAMNGLMEKRRDIFADASELEGTRDRAAGIRHKTLTHLPELLEKLETNCESNEKVISIKY